MSTDLKVQMTQEYSTPEFNGRIFDVLLPSPWVGMKSNPFFGSEEKIIISEGS